VLSNRRGEPEPDSELRDQDNVPLPQVSARFEPDLAARLSTVEYQRTVEDHAEAEVRPYLPDAWIDHAKTRIGYEIPFTSYFYRYTPPRSLDEIDVEIEALESEIQGLLRKVTE
jgi:type I restriction enzyme M protein